MKDSSPLVSVVTPLYNGEKYLEECICSVINQTYENWEYLIVNNCSNDNSLNIAQRYAREDDRITIVNNKEFLGAIENQNHALSLISPESKYCKIVHADDWLYSQCIEMMVDISEKNPNVGIVSSYVLSDRIHGFGLPYDVSVVPGKVPCRLWLLENKYLFGNPSSLMIKSNLIRERGEFYQKHYHNTDQIVCFELLEKCDFAFIHQILSYMRSHGEQVSSFVVRCKVQHIYKMILIKMFAPIYLSQAEAADKKKKLIRKYIQLVSGNLNFIFDKECLSFHRENLKELKISFNKILLLCIILKPFELSVRIINNIITTIQNQ